MKARVDQAALVHDPRLSGRGWASLASLAGAEAWMIDQLSTALQHGCGQQTSVQQTFACCTCTGFTWLHLL